jgi:hypothetical protein
MEMAERDRATGGCQGTQGEHALRERDHVTSPAKLERLHSMTSVLERALFGLFSRR